MPQKYITVLYIFLCSQCHMIGDCPSREKRYVVYLNEKIPIMCMSRWCSSILSQDWSLEMVALICHLTRLAEHWVCRRTLRVLYVSLIHFQRLGAIWPGDLCAFSPLHLLETFTVLPFRSPVCIRLSLLECDGEELCLVPAFSNTRNIKFLILGNRQVSRWLNQQENNWN